VVRQSTDKTAQYSSLQIIILKGVYILEEQKGLFVLVTQSALHQLDSTDAVIATDYSTWYLWRDSSTVSVAVAVAVAVAVFQESSIPRRFLGDLNALQDKYNNNNNDKNKKKKKHLDS
jgi:hypothetical protein